MWFHLELRGKGYGSAYAGVATATKPTGPFTFLKAGRVNPGKWPLNLDKKDQTTEFTKEIYSWPHRSQGLPRRPDEP